MEIQNFRRSDSKFWPPGPDRTLLGPKGPGTLWDPKAPGPFGTQRSWDPLGPKGPRTLWDPKALGPVGTRRPRTLWDLKAPERTRPEILTTGPDWNGEYARTGPDTNNWN